jgi:hypothetical protein
VKAGAPKAGAPPLPQPPWPHVTAPEPAQRGWIHFAWILGETTGFLFVAVLLLAPGVLLVLTDQGKDLLQAVADGLADGGSLFDRTLVWLFAGAAFLGLQAWFWTRWIVEWRFGPRVIWPVSRYVVWAPRVLAVVPFVFLGAGFGLIGATDVRLWVLVAVGIAVAAFVGSRAWLEAHLRRAADNLAAANRLTASRAVHGSLRLGHDLVFWGSIALALAGLIAFWFWPVAPAQYFGPAGVGLLGVGLIIPLVTPAIVWGRSHAFATVPALLALSMLFSLWDDNHHVRVTRSCAEAACGREGVEAAFVRWRRALPADGPAVEPIIFVASQGGASRAGYWTAAALALLEEQTGGRFSRHVFAISSVSGGTLGAAAFLAAIHDQPDLAAKGQLRPRLQQFVAQDYLSPALGGLLFPDLLQRFVPFPFLPDRGTALERGWEAGWDKLCAARGAGCKADRMQSDFLDLWQNKATWLPILMVGGATEETGRPLLTSSVDFGEWRPDAPRDPALYVEAGDFHRVMQGRDVRLSTAILNGARFPYISPAGTLTRGQHVVDGGYFDAAGVETIRQLAQRLFDPAHPPPPPAPGERAVRLRPVYILLLNGEPAELSKKKGGQQDRFAQDLWGPVRGLYHGRSAHGERLIANLEEGRPGPAGDAATAPVFIRLQVCHRLAMDWVLSPKMTKTLRADLERDQPGCPNATGLRQVRELLGVPAPPQPASPPAR